MVRCQGLRGLGLVWVYVCRVPFGPSTGKPSRGNSVRCQGSSWLGLVLVYVCIVLFGTSTGLTLPREQRPMSKFEWVGVGLGVCLYSALWTGSLDRVNLPEGTASDVRV